ncbi:DNA recombination protein RmuC [Phyllobacterium salinisoli]|uniref:DNA recombination protein RmuC homolog n=1 Tax=Phyllobacterium salinisoli TaxID=1899321 RepID=A0A368K9N2_9HYPH|nr:DNA recombination protein RmuC [Phyllobacterium salinisoli]RCS24800.1 DNA recombination protein RmuC [Phyllobacterium salinisoli]
MDTTNLLAAPLFQLGVHVISVGGVLLLGLGVVVFFALFFLMAAWRSARSRAVAEVQAAERARDAEIRMAEILKSQAEMQGRMQTMAEVFGSRQAELNQSIRERLDGMTSRIGQTMTEQSKSTHENLAKLQERLAVIDTAQNNIQALAGQVVQLQAILANKQTRGAFGQSRMEAIIADGLPLGAYEFQATLSNGNRPDCVVRMPNGMPSLVVDAKFPLEAWSAIRDAEAPEEKKLAIAQFRRDIEVHIRDISVKYLIQGETQETAFLFVPSESIFAEIHENFEGLVQKAHRSRIVIVSPSLLMLSIQVIQAVLKDARMREQAHLIQGEVIRLMEDVSRLDERVRKLQGHFMQANKDIDDILVSSNKVTRRGEKIEALEFGEKPEENAPRPPAKTADSTASATTGQLRLRVVEDE